MGGAQAGGATAGAVETATGAATGMGAAKAGGTTAGAVETATAVGVSIKRTGGP